MAERSFKAQVEDLKLRAGETFTGEGILAITKALLESGVGYVGGYQGAPISHLMDVLADAQDLLAELGVRYAKGAAKFPKGLRVSVGDQFTAPAAVYDVKKPLRLCLPVAVNGGAVAQPATALTCYATKLAALKPKQPKHVPRLGVHVANEFGALTVDTRKDRALCLRADVPRPD